MATILDQPLTVYSDTTPQVRVISDVIKLISPRDTPLIAALGGMDGARKKFKISQNGWKLEWLEDELEPLSTTMAVATIATDTTTMAVTDASIFQDGDIIKIDSELMVVKSITNNIVTVYDRTYGGTNATHTSTATVEIVGMARLTGDDADYGPVVDISAPFNYTAIYQKGLNVSGTLEKITQYGISNEFDYQSLKAIPSIMRKFEKALFYSLKQIGTVSSPRSMGGLGSFIGSNTVAAGNTIAKSDLDLVMEYIYDDGGNPDLFVCNPGVAADLKGLIDSSSYVKLNYENIQIGMSPIQRVVTQYGALQIIMDRFCPLETAYVLDSSKIGIYSLRPFFWAEMAKTGDSHKAELVGEFSLIVANNEGHGTVTGITR